MTTLIYVAPGSRERYGGTEFSLTDLVDKAKIDIVVNRCACMTPAWYCLGVYNASLTLE